MILTFNLHPQNLTSSLSNLHTPKLKILQDSHKLPDTNAWTTQNTIHPASNGDEGIKRRMSVADWSNSFEWVVKSKNWILPSPTFMCSNFCTYFIILAVAYFLPLDVHLLFQYFPLFSIITDPKTHTFSVNSKQKQCKDWLFTNV